MILLTYHIVITNHINCINRPVFFTKKRWRHNCPAFFGTLFLQKKRLIQKCLAISAAPLAYLLKRLPNRFKYYIHFDYESCKILQVNGLDMHKLYFLASSANNYEAIIYLLDRMSLNDFTQILTSYEHFDYHLSNILLIDKIHRINDESTCALLKSKMLCFILVSTNISILIRCYYIIKYITNNSDYSHVISSDKDNKRYTPLLDFHLRPRGKRTKNAIHYS
jgi:hypothetical protein